MPKRKISEFWTIKFLTVIIIYNHYLINYIYSHESINIPLDYTSRSPTLQWLQALAIRKATKKLYPPKLPEITNLAIKPAERNETEIKTKREIMGKKSY